MYFYFDFNNLLLFLVMGLAAGFIANGLAGKDKSSLLSNLLLGIAGAFIGGLIFPAIGLRPWGFIGNFLAATAGAVLILIFGRLFTGSNTRV